jgi:hypothetical protein
MRLRGQVLDAATGEPVAASVHVIGSTGHAVIPPDAIERRGSGHPAFYCDGEFSLSHYATFAGSRIASNTRGHAFPAYFSGLMDILVERGTEYIPLHRQLDLRGREAVVVELLLERWIDLRAQGWYPGNTHIHYDESEQRPDERLRIEPIAHDLDLAALSILEKRGLPYASNMYPAGVLEEFSSPGHVIECGEEARHNEGLFSSGYGHVLLLRLQEYVQPVSRGMLKSDQAPDFPPLTLACDATQQQGGVVIWAHNGNGMEAPIAAAMGKIDAINLFDYYWMEPEYEIWYHLLNCGFRLPASTGSDWFICNHNRVYIHIEGVFSYDAWWDGLLAGRTFITNGPALFLSVEGHGPGETLEISPTSKLAVTVTWKSHRPIHSLDVIHNGTVIAHRDFKAGNREGRWDFHYTAEDGGWLAVRCAGTERDSFDQPLFAHTSPVYLSGEHPSGAARQASAECLMQAIDDSLRWIKQRGRFDDHEQRETTRGLFLEAREIYEELARA